MSIYTKTICFPDDIIPVVVTFDMRRFSGLALNASLTHPNRYTLKICLDCGEAVYVNAPLKSATLLANIAKEITERLAELTNSNSH